MHWLQFEVPYLHGLKYSAGRSNFHNVLSRLFSFKELII